MRRLIKQIITIMLMISCIVCISGCKKEEEVFPYQIFEVNSSNELLYDKIVCVYETKNGIQDIYYYRPIDRYRNLYQNTLAVKLMLYEEDEDKLYHVIISCFLEEEASESIKRINEEKGLQLNIDEWYSFEIGFPVPSYYYYYVFTLEEIEALTGSGLSCRYVGSGEGTESDVNFDTPEGLDAYCELYGDGFIQYREGVKIYEYEE